MVVLLALLSTFSFLDRNVLALLLPDVKHDIGITDVEFGFLAGPCFIIVYNVTLIFGSLVVDRWNRKLLIVIGAVIWSAMTIASAAANSYTELLICRAGLSFGEALLGPSAISLIGGLFERTERPLPTAIYIAGSVIGVTGSTMISAMVLQTGALASNSLVALGLHDAWRLALVSIGLPSLVTATLLLVIGREPARVALDFSAGCTGETLVDHLRSHARLYGGIFLGYGMLGTISVAIVTWGPTHLIRYFGLSQVRAGYLLGLPILICSVIGTLTLPIVFRRFIRIGRADHMVTLAAATILGASVLAALGGTAGTLSVCLMAFAAAMSLAMGVGTLSTLVVQLYAPPHLRGRVSALLFFTVYLFSAGLTPIAIPLLARGLFSGNGATGNALAALALCAGTLSSLLVISARGPMQAAERRTATHPPQWR
jgi:hypothetical protein